MNADEARKVLEDERRKRLEACQAALNALLAEHKCSLAYQLGIVDGRIVGNVVLVGDNAD